MRRIKQVLIDPWIPKELLEEVNDALLKYSITTRKQKGDGGMLKKKKEKEKTSNTTHFDF